MTFSIVEIRYRRILGCLINNEPEMTRKAAIVAKFEVGLRSQYLPGGTEEKHADPRPGQPKSEFGTMKQER